MEQQKLDKCRKYLPGLTAECPDEFEKLAQVLGEHVLEIWPGKQKDTFCAAYLMNDSVESYLIFTDAHMVGEFETGREKETEASLSVEEDSYVLAVRQGDRNSFTIRFRQLKFEIHLYTYSGIAHVWVSGGEHLRQLVYRLGIVRDKFRFLGERYCTEEEQELLPLLEFAPFRAWYPVPWDEGRVFQTTERGLEAMRRIAGDVQDTEYEKVLDHYEAAFGKKREVKIGRKLYEMLNQAEHMRLYDRIRKKINRAAGIYAARSFGKGDSLIKEKRGQITDLFHENGFNGSYPWFKKFGDNMKVSCYMLEEQPFACGGTGKYRFYYFWSEVDEKLSEKSRHLVDEGFFEGEGRRHRIQAEEIDLEV